MLNFSYMVLLKHIISTKNNGLYNPEGFIFSVPDGHMLASTTDSYITHLCEKLRFRVRSMHKIRKTVISALIDSVMNLDEVRRFAGHEDIRTLLKSYCFSRQTNHENENLMEKVLCNQV